MLEIAGHANGIVSTSEVKIQVRLTFKILNKSYQLVASFFSLGNSIFVNVKI